jgi:DNA transformation protein
MPVSDEFLVFVLDQLAFKPFADKPVIMSYYELPPDVLESPEELIDWARRSLAVQSGKKKKGRRP